MNSFKTTAAALALTMVLGLAGICAAQTGPKPVTTTEAAPSGVLTEESLKTMLNNLGYTVEEKKSKDGAALFYFQAAHGNLTYNPYIGLSADKTRIWIDVALAEIGPEDAARALKLLELNHQIGPAHFVYRPAHKMIYMYLPMDNRGVTPQILRKQIEDLLANCESTKEVWNGTKPVPTTQVAPPK